MTSVLQPWVEKLPMMQQTVLLTAVRGPDGLAKEHVTKYLLRWLRRCVLYSAIDHLILETPHDQKGGNFTGPSLQPGVVVPSTKVLGPADDQFLVQIEDWETPMTEVVKSYLKVLDELPLHFHGHLIDAVKVIGYKHSNERIRKWWHSVYVMLVRDMHLHPETVEELDFRLSDNKEQWQARRVVS